MDYPELLKGYKSELVKLQEILLKERENRQSDEENAIELLTKVKKNYDQRFKELKDEYESKVSDLREHIDDLKNEQKKLEDDLKDERLNKQLDAITENNLKRKSLSNLNKSINQNKSSNDLASLKEELKQLKEEKLSQKCSDKELQLESKLSEMEDLRRKLDELEISLNHKDNEISNLKLDLRMATRESNRSQEHMKFLRESNRELKDKINQLEIELKQFEFKDTNKESEVNSLKGMYDETLKKNEELKLKLSAFDEEKQKMNGELQKLRSQLKNQEEQNNKQRQTNLKLKDVLDTVSKQNEELQVLYDDQLSVNGRLENENIKCLKKIDMLKNELDHFKEKVESTDQEFDKLEDQFKGKESELKKENKRLLDQIEELKVKLDNEIENSSNYLNEITKLQNDQFAKDYELARFEERLKNDTGLMNKLKEEASRSLTIAEDLKEKNYSLAKMYDDLYHKYTQAKNRIASLQEEIDLKGSNFEKEKLILQQTVHQKSKVIDLLIDEKENSKKSWFGGSSDKGRKLASALNASTPTSAKKINHDKEIESAYEREKQKNKILMQQINELERNQKKRKNDILEEDKRIKKEKATAPSVTEDELSNRSSSDLDANSLDKMSTHKLSRKNLNIEEEFTFTESIMEELAYKDD